MRAATFWKTVTSDASNFLGSLIALPDQHAIPYCAIGGQGVNAYVEPLVSLDLDLVIAADRLGEMESLLRPHFGVEAFPHSLAVSMPGSSLRVQIQTDPRCAPFVHRSTRMEVLGVSLPVAALEDVLQGKIWAASDEQRRASQGRKDLLDIERILESYPRLRSLVPPEILARLDRTAPRYHEERRKHLPQCL